MIRMMVAISMMLMIRMMVTRSDGAPPHNYDDGKDDDDWDYDDAEDDDDFDYDYDDYGWDYDDDDNHE